jgi:phosphoribosylaminoimidazole-succinocarboxamide synthase
MTTPLIHQGKVRDTHRINDAELLIKTSDRLSAFDRAVCDIPGKGALLNQLAAFWFEQTKHIVDNHLITVDSPNSMRVKSCQPIPIEVVVRGYLTGSTSTAIWTQYQAGERTFFNTTLPEGLLKNTPLPTAILTPTTKAEAHDEPMSPKDVAGADFITQGEWDFIADKALALFAFGQQYAAEKGLILVDTKYEFGRDTDGNIILIDEMHTSDSSRYWNAATYAERVKQGLEPESFDKEIIRLWLREHCDPYDDDVLPKVPAEIIQKLHDQYAYLLKTLAPKESP